jgi:hypothetical protein
MTRARIPGASIWRRFDEERGAVAVMVALLLVVLLGSAAVAIDLARLRHERHLLQAAVDLGSLAGAGLLPATVDTWTLADATARDIAAANAPDVGWNNFQVSFGCVVSDPEGDGGGDSPDLAFACRPATDGAWADASNWVSRRGRAFHTPCQPAAGDTCNSISVTASRTIDFFFAPILGFESGSTGALNATACHGNCGFIGPLDIVFVIDRTASMTQADINNVKSALANPTPEVDSVLEFLQPRLHYVGLVALPYAGSSGDCNIEDPQVYPDTNWADWWLAGETGLRTGYNNNGVLVQSDPLVSTINCLQRAPNLTIIDDGVEGRGNHTDHGDAIAAGQQMLVQKGRPGVQDVIVFLADGQSNRPQARQPCQYAYNYASAAKGDGTIVFTLGYGLDGNCLANDSPQFAGRPAEIFLAAAASPDPTTGLPSTADKPTCDEENADGDSYFCESRGGDLQSVFLQIVTAAVQRSRLLNF